MRIGIMLRTLDEKGGIGVYSRHLTEELLDLDKENDYVLLYRSEANLGRFAHHERVKERVVPGPGKLLWDQFGVPFVCWREKLDVVLHPKFTVPFLAPCKTVMVLHGAGWFIPEVKHFWSKLENANARIMMPLYCRRAAAVLSVSKITTEVFNRVLGLREGKIRTVYFGPGRKFRRVEAPGRRHEVRKKYSLPERFILTVSGYAKGPRKNIDKIFEAYRAHHGKTRHKLVVVGKDCEKFREDFGLEGPIGEDIVFPGWVDQDDLPVFYTLADLFLYPSHMEAFPIPITEALACGTAIITSKAYGLQELAGEAAVLVDPHDADEIAEALERVLSDDTFRAELSARSLARSEMFSWQKCARETLAILEEITRT